MIRRTVIIALTVATATTGIVAIVGACHPTHWGFVSGTHLFSFCATGMKGGFIWEDHDTHSNAMSLAGLHNLWRPMGLDGEFKFIWRRKITRDDSSHSGRYSVRSFVRTWIIMPLWIPFLAFGIFPAIAFARGPFRRWRQPGDGYCIRCGYDLTGNVSGVCPECGSPVSSTISHL